LHEQRLSHFGFRLLGSLSWTPIVRQPEPSSKV
jgi:hypothetical protein